MKRLLRIGTLDNRYSTWQAANTQIELAKIGIETTVTVFGTPETHPNAPALGKTADKIFSKNELEAALLRGEIDFSVHELSDLPTEKTAGLVLTAVSERENPADWLILKEGAIVPGLDFEVKKGATIAVATELQKMQLAHFRPDLQFIDLRASDDWQSEGMILAAAIVTRFKLQPLDYQAVELSPMEFVPAPGQGVSVWQTNINDRETRIILNNLHNHAVVPIVNIERNIQKIIELENQSPVGAFCKKDAAGNFHVVAATLVGGEWRQTRLSSNTSFGLAERVAKQLLNPARP